MVNQVYVSLAKQPQIPWLRMNGQLNWSINKKSLLPPSVWGHCITIRKIHPCSTSHEGPAREYEWIFMSDVDDIYLDRRKILKAVEQNVGALMWRLSTCPRESLRGFKQITATGSDWLNMKCPVDGKFADLFNLFWVISKHVLAGWCRTVIIYERYKVRYHNGTIIFLNNTLKVPISLLKKTIQTSFQW